MWRALPWPLAVVLINTLGCAQLVGIEKTRAQDGDAGPDEVIDAAGDDGIDAATVQTGCDAVDLLFIIDDSASMTEEQDNLRINAPNFIEVLEHFQTPDGDPLDFRIGITTPSRDIHYTLDVGPPFPPFEQNEMGDNGALRNNCDLDRRWIEQGDPDVAGLFGCRASVGVAGSSLEMPLMAIQLATNDRVIDGTNTGFLRATAPLVVIVMSDEDDCSRAGNDFVDDGSGLCKPADLEPVLQYRDYLDSLKGARDRWAMAVIAGPGPEPCTSAFGMAEPANRMLELQADVGDSVIFESVCSGNLAIALDRILEAVEATCARQ